MSPPTPAARPRPAWLLAGRATVGLATSALALLAAASPAWASGSGAGSPTVASSTAGASPSGASASGGTSVGSLQEQAAEIASAVAADNRTVDQLDAAFDAANIRYRDLQARERRTTAQIASITTEVGVARQALKEQVLLAYMAGGTPAPAYVAVRGDADPSVAISYASILSAGQKAALDRYRSTLTDLARTRTDLSATEQQAALALADIHASETEAAAALADRRRALASVTGQLAVAVSQAEAARQAAQAQAVQTRLAAQGQLPAASGSAQAPGGTTGSSAGGAGSAASGSSPGPAGSGAQASGSAASGAATSAASPTTPPPTPAPTPPPSPATVAAPPPTTAAPVPTTSAPAPAPPSSGSLQPQAPGANQALAYARAQIGKPYQWGAAGPNSFDCSGLVMMAWEQGGIYFPHLAQYQYDLTEREPLSAALPGDLIFFGTPDNVYHVGIYIGSGEMIDAPETGQTVQIQSIYWDSLLGAGRVTVDS